MKFWDTSPVVPLCVNEPNSGTRKIISQPRSINGCLVGNEDGMCFSPHAANPRRQLAERR